jgi:hypothetical protein
MNTRSLVASAVCLVAPIVALACSGGNGDDSSHAPEDIGQATAAITLVPASVACVDIQVASGARTIDQRFTVTPGQPATLVLAGLPLGAVVFSGLAYPTACASLTANTAATWATDPTAAVLSPGVGTNIELAFHAAGVADVGINFDDAGVAPLLTFSTSILDFTDLACFKGGGFGTVNSQPLTVTNQAPWPVVVTSASAAFVSSTDPAPVQVYVEEGSSFTLAAGASITLQVNASPGGVGIPWSTGWFAGETTFTTNTAGDVPYLVDWEGYVYTANFAFSPTTITAGQSTVLTNTGASPGSYSVPSATPSSGTLAPGASVTMTFPTAGDPVPMTFAGQCTPSQPPLNVLAAIKLPPIPPVGGGGGTPK